jgi:hypothetical protein
MASDHHRYGCHLSEQTNLIPSDNGSPMRVKNCSKLSIVRSLPIHNSRAGRCGFAHVRVDGETLRKPTEKSGKRSKLDTDNAE